MPSQADKLRLFDLMFEAKTAPSREKAEAWGRFYAEVDRVRRGTMFSAQQVHDFLYKTGYIEYARRRRIEERNGL